MTYKQMQKAAYEHARISTDDYLHGEMHADMQGSKVKIGLFLLGVAVGMTITLFFDMI